MRFTLLALMAAAAMPASAQQPALGRLFASPAERSALDRQRDAGPAAAPAMPGASVPSQAGMAATAQAQMADVATPMQMAAAAQAQMAAGMPPPGAAQPVAPAAGAPPSSSVQLSGVLRGSSGRTTVWLNQVPQSDSAKAGPGQAVSLRLSSGRQLILKPGQSFDPANGSVQEIGH
ncbi:hypothetical protein D0T23_15620 [Duganella sp. BJB475]|nr:hypothetical protein D0T23_15620 [Duganella sp. BJB475]RFP36532.1 hypothetical protein D0T21_08975 [Duganella sp. BJB476]